MLSKHVLLTIILVFVLTLLYGFKKILFCLFTCLIGYVAGYILFKKSFSFPLFYSVIKSKSYLNINSISTNQQDEIDKHSFYLRRSSNIKGSTSTSSISALLLKDDDSTSKRVRSSTSINNTNYGSIKSNNDNSNSFQIYLKKTHPWTSVFIPDNVDKALEEFLSLCIQDFILNWYTKISSDDGLIYELKCAFRHILANFIIRLKRIDLNHFVTYKLNTILFNHIKDFANLYNNSCEQIDLKSLNTIDQRLSKQHDIFKLLLLNSESNEETCHFALKSRKHEIVYLRQVCKHILPLVLPDYITKCKISTELVEEVVVSNLLIKGLDILAEPDTINKLIIQIIKNHNENKEIKHEERSYVQVLKHWCQMNGCIFKSIQAPSLKEIIDNNDLLHHFINYLNTLNSLCVLQLYLALNEIIKSNEENSSSFSHQVDELKIWCQIPSNKQMLETLQINSNKSYLELLNKAINNFDLDQQSDITQHSINIPILNEIHSDLYMIIRDIYYSSFIKSDYMYKNLIGLNRRTSSKINLKNSNKKSNDYTNSETRSDKDSCSLNIIDDYFNDLDEDVSDFMNECGTNSFYNKETFNINESKQAEDEDYDDEDDYDDAFCMYRNEDDDLTNKSGCEVRLDLINEIKDEFLDEDSITRSNLSANDKNSLIDFEESNDEDENEEDELNENNNVNNVNLNNLRICIDEIQELVDKSNKTCYVFIIEVWNLQAKETMQNKKSGDGKENHISSSWSVKRKYDEFYVLDSRLREFHGGLFVSSDSISNLANQEQIFVQLPSKQRALFFLNNSRNIEFLYSIKDDFAKYLQSLLTNPILCMSQLLKSFLDPHSIEFSSSIFNDITNLGKMVKGVPYKLRLERGQSLDTFLLDLLQAVKPPKPKPIRNQTLTNNFDIIESKLNNPMYINPDKNDSNPCMVNIKNNQINNNLKKSNFSFTTPFESFICLITHVYKLPKFVCLIVFSLRKLIKTSFDYYAYRTVSNKIEDLTSSESIENLINLFKEIVFSDSKNDNLNVSSEILHEKAFESINNFIWKDVLDILIKNSIISKVKLEPEVENGSRLFLESFQYPIWNKNLSYMLLDALIEELFPELDNN